jgi:hypothetical protein
MADNKDNSRADLFAILNELHNDNSEDKTDASSPVAEEKNGKLFLSYDGITSEIVADSPLKRLFIIAEDFSLRQHKISTKGIEMIEGITEEGRYEVEFDCFNKKIVSIKTEDTQYIFR